MATGNQRRRSLAETVPESLPEPLKGPLLEPWHEPCTARFQGCKVTRQPGSTKVHAKSRKFQCSKGCRIRCQGSNEFEFCCISLYFLCLMCGAASCVIKSWNHGTLWNAKLGLLQPWSLATLPGKREPKNFEPCTLWNCRVDALLWSYSIFYKLKQLYCVLPLLCIVVDEPRQDPYKSGTIPDAWNLELWKPGTPEPW